MLPLLWSLGKELFNQYLEDVPLTWSRGEVAGRSTSHNFVGCYKATGPFSPCGPGWPQLAWKAGAIAQFVGSGHQSIFKRIKQRRGIFVGIVFFGGGFILWVVGAPGGFLASWLLGFLAFGVLAHPSIYQSFRLSISLSLYLSIYLSIHLSIHPSIYPSIHLSSYLSIYLSINPSSYLSIYQSI